jgi:UDP-4-amino-4,6-dideoxy-N-acetyl-beta-L-altrosamine transaminase
MMKRIPYGRHFISEEDLKAVKSALLSDFITQGQHSEEFEKAFAEYTGAKYAVAVSNGTAALHIAAKAAGIKAGDKVITTPLTFVASANCVKFCGGDIYFSDIDRRTYLLDPVKLEALLRSKPAGTFKGIIPVDFAGYPLNMEKFRKLADKYGLWIIEDACHAPGAWYVDSNGTKQKTGNCAYADMAVFSFHPVKHITTGEGGMITTNDDNLYKKLILYRSHGITKRQDMLTENHGGWYYEMHELSHNFRLTDFQSALGRSQLKRADSGLKRRQEIAGKYDKAFAGSKIRTPFYEKNTFHAFHLYVIEVPDRLNFYNYLVQNNIFAQIHYIPVHYMPYYKQFGWKIGDFPMVEDYYEHCISLPIFPTLTEKEQDYVIKKILKYYK